MKHLAHFIFFFALLLAVQPIKAAQAVDHIDWTSSSILREEVENLCDTLMAGRAFGDGGIQLASFYLLRQFRAEGLRTSVQSFEEGGKIGHNIIAVTPGWFKEYIVIGAYYDGIGRIGGKIYPAADSNASGVAALLSLARSLPQSCDGAIGIIFVAFDGHNSDLCGAREFVARFKQEYKISLMINLDILGHSSASPLSTRRDYLIALGGLEHNWSLENANRIDRLHLSYDYYGSELFTEIFYRKVSEQKWFLNAGIPSVMFTAGISDHTNKLSDTAENLDYQVFSRRVSLIKKWIILLLGRNRL